MTEMDIQFKGRPLYQSKNQIKPNCEKIWPLFQISYKSKYAKIVNKQSLDRDSFIGMRFVLS